MAHRYSLEEFPGLIRKEGGLVGLFIQTTIGAADVPAEIQAEVREINRLHVELDQLMSRVADACGYNEDEEN